MGAKQQEKNPTDKSTVDKNTCKQLIAKELEQLNLLSLDPDMQQDSKMIYTNLFPLTCDSCGKHYETRNDFLNQTTALAQGSLFFDEGGLRESRKCSCGKIISLWEKGVDRRNGSYLGVLKRILFENCLTKLKEQQPHNHPEELKTMLRHFFRSH